MSQAPFRGVPSWSVAGKPRRYRHRLPGSRKQRKTAVPRRAVIDEVSEAWIAGEVTGQQSDRAVSSDRQSDCCPARLSGRNNGPTDLRNIIREDRVLQFESATTDATNIPGALLDIVLLVMIPWPPRTFAMAPPTVELTILRAKVLLLLVILPPSLIKPPPPSGAVLLIKALLSMFTMPLSLYMPPPLPLEPLPVMVLWVIITVPALKIPAPKVLAVLPAIMLSGDC